jgi:transducin (beta)-like 1
MLRTQLAPHSPRPLSHPHCALRLSRTDKIEDANNPIRPQLSEEDAALAAARHQGVFGPLITQPPPTAKTEEKPRVQDTNTTPAPGPADDDASRKRPQNPLLNGSPAKRPRLSNGYENGTDTVADASDQMDIDPQDDQSHDNHAYPSPFEGEAAATPVVHTTGPEQGTQVDKVEELSPVTTFIRLSDDSRHGADSHTSPASSADANAVSSPNAPILLQCEWNPRDPSILAAAGTDALARLWTVSRVAASESEPAHDNVSPHGQALLSPDLPSNTSITAMAWTSDGSSLAVATDSGSQASINVCSSDGTLLQAMEVSEPPVVKLSWNPSNTALLAISYDKTGALVTVYYASAGNSLSHRIEGYDIDRTTLDATWTSDGEFLLSGGDMLVSLYCADSSIVQVRKFETKEDDSFNHVLFDWRSKLAATSSDKGTLDLWGEAGQRRSISAHRGAITTMAWQPLPPMQPNADDERLIATGGEDCAILIWNARMPEQKAKCFLTMDSPIVRLAFTPDGAFLAGATASQVLIWKVENTAIPRAKWSRPPHPGWLSPNTNSESDVEDEHCLCWDASGQKLAYGSNNRVSPQLLII